MAIPEFEYRNNQWVEKQLHRARTFAFQLRNLHNSIIKKSEDYFTANTLIRESVEKLWVRNIHFAADDQEIRDIADSFADRYKRRFASQQRINPGREKAVFEAEYGFELPKDTNADRLSCPKFWRRQLRKVSGRRVEQLNRELMLTRKGVAPYVSEWTFRRYLERCAANKTLLENMEATNDQGQIYTLRELSELGISNPTNLRNELMTRLDGFEKYSELPINGNWVPLFYTWTCPSRFHPRSGKGKNPQYQGATPIEAQKWLNAQWAKSRSVLDKENIEYFGFRVAEPHQDGTPHWHMLFFVSKEHETRLTEVLKHYVMEESPDEPGARKHRFQVKAIDTDSGRATGYLAKYIAKNVDGFGDFEDESGESSVNAALRVKAWSSIWGIRQFQQIGGPPVTVWRECRKLASNHATLNFEPSETDQEIIDAADKGDWCDFVLKMGGAVCRKIFRPLQVAHFTKPRRGLYGDVINVVRGLWSEKHKLPIDYQRPEWTIQYSPKMRWGKIFSQGPPAVSLEFCQ